MVKILFENVRRCLTDFKNFTELFHCSQCSVKCCMRLTTLPNISSNNLIQFYIHACVLSSFCTPCDGAIGHVETGSAVSKCSMKCSMHLTTLRSNIERFWLFHQLQCSVKCSARLTTGGPIAYIVGPNFN